MDRGNCATIEGETERERERERKEDEMHENCCMCTRAVRIYIALGKENRFSRSCLRRSERSEIFGRSEIAGKKFGR